MWRRGRARCVLYGLRPRPPSRWWISRVELVSFVEPRELHSITKLGLLSSLVCIPRHAHGAAPERVVNSESGQHRVLFEDVR